MSSVNFNLPDIEERYGISGLDTVRKMNEAAELNSLGIDYNDKNKEFTILGSDLFSKNCCLQRIFDENTYYQNCRPLVLDKTVFGNHIVKLVTITNSSTAEDSCRTADIPTNTRDNIAAHLVRNIESLCISLYGKKVIDVGCRSGENTLAMQASGAKVIGIDPDDEEFLTAKAKVLKDSQLIKTTLQEYHTKFPKKSFDIATVFLWNIPFLEREFFATTLKKILNKNGCVIIGYADKIYDNDPVINLPKLMKTVFYSVERIEFPESVNKYMLVCKFPIHYEKERSILFKVMFNCLNIIKNLGKFSFFN